MEEARRLLFPKASRHSRRERNRIADIDHLFGHRRSGADHFVTLEKGILAQAPALEKRFRISVKAPLDAIRLSASDAGL